MTSENFPASDLWTTIASVVLVIVIGAAFFLLTSALRRGTGAQRWLIRAPLAVLWIMTYVSLVIMAGVLAEDVGVNQGTVVSAAMTLVGVGAVALILQLVYWSRAARRRVSQTSATVPFVPISGDISPLPTFGGALGASPAPTQRIPGAAPLRPAAPFSLFRTAFEGLALPLRRPVLFVPFIFYMFALSLTLQALGLSLDDLEKPDFALGTVPTAILVYLAFTPVFTLALETTSHMAAEVELGRPLRLDLSLRLALRRLLSAFVVQILYVLGVLLGFLLLIVPGIVLTIRWILITQAVMIGGADIAEAFSVSSRLTRGRWWRFTGLLFLVSIGILLLTAALDLVPQAGRLASGWLEFAWSTIALTLAYVRSGGPVQPAE